MEGTRAHLFVLIGLYAGLRREEICALQWDCVFLDCDVPYIEVRRSVQWVQNNQAVVSDKLKSKKSYRKNPIAPQLLGPLTQAKEAAASDFVVPDTNGNVMSYTSFTRLWGIIDSRSAGTVRRKVNGEVKVREKKLGAKAARHNIVISIDFPVTPHLLRHTFISNLIVSGANIKTVQYLAGHATVQMTLNIYAHLMENQPKDTLVAITSAYGEPQNGSENSPKNSP